MLLEAEEEASSEVEDLWQVVEEMMISGISAQN